jgi:cytochrome P450
MTYSTHIDARDPEGGIEPMSDTQLRDEVMTIFLAGHETTANALTWTFYLLSQNPEVEHKLFRELHSVLGNDTVGCQQLKTLQCWTKPRKYLENPCVFILRRGRWAGRL